MPNNVRRCRVCGCTDEDCSECIKRTGRTCHWVSEDLCSACAEGFNTLIRVSRGNTNVAAVRVGGKTFRCSSTSSELSACRGAADKAAVAVRANTWRVEQYRTLSMRDRTLSMRAGRAALFLEFAEGAR